MSGKIHLLDVSFEMRQDFVSVSSASRLKELLQASVSICADMMDESREVKTYTLSVARLIHHC